MSKQIKSMRPRQMTLRRLVKSELSWCDKCGARIERGEYYRVFREGSLKRHRYCSDCIGFILSRYSFITIDGKLTEAEQKAHDKYFDQAVDWAFGDLGA